MADLEFRPLADYPVTLQLAYRALLGEPPEPRVDRRAPTDPAETRHRRSR